MHCWFVSQQGRVTGPFPFDELRSMAGAGQLNAADAVCPEGSSKWVAAGSVATLFASESTIPQGKLEPAHGVRPRPQAAVRAEPEDEAPQRPPWIRALLAIPKPILFALCGALGGLFGAVFLGEALWIVASPPILKEQAPHIDTAVPAAMKVYAGGKNRFNVKVVRHGFDGPVRVDGTALPKGVSLSGGFIDEDQDETEIEVQVAKGAPPGKHVVHLLASGPPAIEASAAHAAITVTILAPPTAPAPALRMTVSAEMSLYRGGKGKLTVRLARAQPHHMILLHFEGAQPGVVAPDVLVPEGQDEIEVEVTAARETALGVHPLIVDAAVFNEPKAPHARADVRMEILAPPAPKVDVLFVLDLTGSMQFAINGIKDGILDFARKLETKAIDSRIGVICFRDIEDDNELPYPLLINGETFTRDYQALRNKVAILKADGGGDEPESSLQALALAGKQPFRDYVTRVLVLITDAPPKVHMRPGREYPPFSVQETVELLKPRDINQFHLVVRKVDYDRYYQQFSGVAAGSFFDISKTQAGGAFAAILPKLGEEISLNTVAAAPLPPKASVAPALPPLQAAETTVVLPPGELEQALKAVQSTQTYSAGQRWRLVLAIAGWTMLIAALMSLMILSGQAFYARQSWPAPLDAVKAVGGGLVAGIVGGCAGQLFFMATSGSVAWEGVSRVAGWSLLGALIGVGLSLFVPNLKWYRGLAGGLVGGFLGAVAFVVVSLALGPLLGRWIGATILGFCIGLMVALAEMAFRRWWLEVSFSPREVRTITLGTAAVSIGGDDRQVSVFVPGAADLALRFRMEDERVVCEDLASGTTGAVQPGDRKSLGTVTVTVCSSSTARQSGFVLRLFTGKTIVLGEGMPLTGEDLPGLLAQGVDGVVALASRRPNDPRVLLLRNRSKQTWSVLDPDGTEKTTGPGLSVELAAGVQIQFGAVKGEVIIRS